MVRQNYIARFRAEAAMPKCSLQLEDWVASQRPTDIEWWQKACQ